MRRVLAISFALVLLISPLLIVLTIRARGDLRAAAPPGHELGLARREVLAGKSATAEIRMRRHLGHHPADARAWQILGECLRLQSRGEEAHAAFRRAADLAPDWDAPAVALASRALAEGDRATAAEILERAFREGGATRGLLRARSILHARVGRFDAAASDLERAANYEDGGALDLLDAARHARTARFVDESQDASDERVRALLTTALQRAESTDISQAIERELNARSPEIESAATHVLHARRAAEAELAGLTQAHLRSALQARPDDPDIAFALGFRWGRARELSATLELIEQLPDGDAGAAGRRLLGWYHVGSGELDRAATFLLPGRERERERLDARLAETLLRARAAGPIAATSAACRDVAARPLDAHPRFVLGMTAERRGDRAEAARHFTAALARDPGLVMAANNLAWSLRGAAEVRDSRAPGDAFGAAQRLAAWAHHLAPTNAQVLDTEATIRRLAGETNAKRNNR